MRQKACISGYPGSHRKVRKVAGHGFGLRLLCSLETLGGAVRVLIGERGIAAPVFPLADAPLPVEIAPCIFAFPHRTTLPQNTPGLKSRIVNSIPRWLWRRRSSGSGSWS